MEWLLLLLPALILILRSHRSRRQGARLFRETAPAWRRTYSRRAFLRLGGAALAAGILAYGGLDGEIESWHARRVRSAGTDRLAAFFRIWGERFWFGVWGLLAAVDAAVRSSAATRWARRNFQAMLVGLPLLWSTQRLLGASRPGQRPWGPRWRPLDNDKAASGHTFVAAVPWLNLARRLPGGAAGNVGRGAAGLASLLTGWSRLDDRLHYPSQILLGWVIAWNATAGVAAIDEAEAAAAAPKAAPNAAPDGPRLT